MHPRRTPVSVKILVIAVTLILVSAGVGFVAYEAFRRSASAETLAQIQATAGSSTTEVSLTSETTASYASLTTTGSTAAWSWRFAGDCSRMITDHSTLFSYVGDISHYGPVVTTSTFTVQRQQASVYVDYCFLRLEEQQPRFEVYVYSKDASDYLYMIRYGRNPVPSLIELQPGEYYLIIKANSTVAYWMLQCYA